MILACMMSAVAYGLGLLVTFLALAVMGRGQPALLYIVPFVLGTTVLISWRRKELRQMWTGQPVSPSIFKGTLLVGHNYQSCGLLDEMHQILN